MKIMYLIYRPDKLVGGHVFSLRTIARAVQSRTPVVVVSLGVRSAALDEGSLPYHNICYHRGHMLAALRQLIQLIRKEKPDVIHSFDGPALFFGRIAAWWHKKGLVHTKCGGPNPGRLYPVVNDLILFSQENTEFFKASRRFKAARLHLIPNRVDEVPQNSLKIADVRASLTGEKRILLRIGRIAREYEKTSQQGVHLVARLQKAGVSIRFVQIGNVQHQESLEQLKLVLGDHDHIFTEARFTVHASECIEAGDIVLGTGRSLMEAASRRRLLLVPVANSELPVLVTPENWRALATTNFSGRGSLPADLQQDPIAAIQRVLQDPLEKHRLSDFGRKMYEEHFSVETVMERYLQIYRELEPSQCPPILDSLVQAVRLFRKSIPVPNG